MKSFPYVRCSRRRSLLSRLAPSILFLSATAVLCQGSPALEGWTSHTWNISDGLPDQSIEAVAQTPDGYLWLGTPHGLARYDGFEFEVISNKTRGALQEFGVSCLLVAKDGALWVGSVGGGVTRIFQGLVAAGYEPGSEGLTVRSLYQDERGTIWAVTSRGLYRYLEGRFTAYAPLGDKVLTSMAPDGRGGLWLAGARLFHIEGSSLSEIPLPYVDSGEVIHGLAVTADGRLWVGTPHGLFELQGNHTPSQVPQIPGHIRALYTDAHNMLWVATSEEGLFVREPTGQVVHVLGMDTVMNRSIRTLTQTSNGDVWAGTTAGLIRISPSGMNLYPISTAAGADFGSIFVDSKDSVWLSAGGLTRFDHGRETNVELDVARRSPIRAFFREKSGATWIGTLGDGCYRTYRGITQHYTDERLIRGFLETKDGTVWIATDGGVARWRGNTFENHTLLHTPSAAVRAMTLGTDGSLWVGTAEGLYLIREGKVVEPKVAELLHHERVWALNQGVDGMLWIGTESGLYAWYENRLIHLDFGSEQTATQSVLSIVEDSKQRILLAQPGTVLRFKRSVLVQAVLREKSAPADTVSESKIADSAELFEVARETGAELYGTIPFAAQADSLGGAWFASYLGLVHIGAGSILANETNPPPLVIKQVTIDGKPAATNGLLNVTSGSRTIQIRAAPILLSSEPGLTIRSRLLGLENSWSPQSILAVSSFSELPPGHYTYRVEASWANSQKTSAIELQIWKEGPLYRRPWFIALMAALAAFVAGMTGFLTYRFKLHQVKLQFRATTAERSRVAREIHDTLLQGCIAVYSLLETYLSIRPQEEFDNDHYLLEHARTQIVETISEARTAIWKVRHAETGTSLNEVLADLLKRMLTHTDIAYTFSDNGNPVKVSPDVEHEIVMAVRESIVNSISHGGPQHITVQISRDHRDADLTVRVIDDGRGFDPCDESLIQSNHFGLTGLRERVSALGGRCAINSAVGKGTTVEITVPASASAKTQKATKKEETNYSISKN